MGVSTKGVSALTVRAEFERLRAQLTTILKNLAQDPVGDFDVDQIEFNVALVVESGGIAKLALGGVEAQGGIKLILRRRPE